MRLRILFLLMAALCLQGCIMIQGLGGSRRGGTMNLEVLEEGKGIFTTHQVLMVPLTGMVNVTGSSGMFGEPGMLVTLKDRLDAAAENPRIKAVVLKIDSPGGTVTASELIHHEIVRFKQRTGKPVLAMMTGTAASGGVYIAMAADRVYALPSTLTGSIGVVMMMPDLTGLSTKIGFDMRIYKSGPFKDAGSMFRRPSIQENEIFQAMIETYYGQFRTVVQDSRKDKGMTEEMLDAIAQGQIFNSDIALENKLIDGIGFPEQVFAAAKQLAGIKDAALVSYEYPYSYRGHFYAQAGGNTAPRAAAPDAPGGGDINLFKLDTRSLTEALAGAQFHYLWMP